MSDFRYLWDALEVAERELRAGRDDQGVQLLRRAGEAIGAELAARDATTAAIAEVETWLRTRPLEVRARELARRTR